MKPLRAAAAGTAVVVLAAWTAAQAPRPPVVLPVERASHVFFARATINGRGPFWLTVDTGATLTVLDPSTVRALGLPVRELGVDARVGVAAGVTSMATVSGVRISLGDAPVFAPAPVYVVPTRDAEGPMGHRIDGILGTDFLRRFVVEFDYSLSRVVLHGPGRAVGRGSASTSVMTDGNVLLAPATLTLPNSETLPVRLLIDTGSSSGLSLNAPFARTHRLEERFPSRELSVAVGINGTTIRGVMWGGRLSLAPGHDLEAPATLSHATADLSASRDFDGILGADWLRQIRLVIDYGRRTLTAEAQR